MSAPPRNWATVNVYRNAGSAVAEPPGDSVEKANPVAKLTGQATTFNRYAPLETMLASESALHNGEDWSQGEICGSALPRELAAQFEADKEAWKEGEASAEVADQQHTRPEDEDFTREEDSAKSVTVLPIPSRTDASKGSPGLKGENRKTSRIQWLSAAMKKEIARATYDPAPIRALMAALECDRSELAEALGTNKSNVSRWLQGTPPSADYFERMKRLADACGIDFNPVGQVRRKVDAPATSPAEVMGTASPKDYENISTLEFDPAHIRALRQLVGMPQAAFARAVGADKSASGHWERGRNPPSARYLVRMKRLAELHGVSFDPI